MNRSDNINFRGYFRQYDVDGRPYLYRIGDSVEYKGLKYVAVKPTSDKIPGTQEGNPIWKELGSENSFYISEPPAPINVIAGDRWWVPSSGVLYTYVSEGINKFWVEL